MPHELALLDTSYRTPVQNPMQLVGDTLYIRLDGGGTTITNADMLPTVSAYRWRRSPDGYAVTDAPLGDGRVIELEMGALVWHASVSSGAYTIVDGRLAKAALDAQQSSGKEADNDR
jgi:hypothetical protein